MQQMTPGTGPELKRRRIGKRGHVLDSHQPAVADRSGEPSAGLPNDVRADDRVHAVGADYQIGCGIRSVRELQLDAGTTLIDAHAAAGEVQPVAAQPLRECLEERDAMHAVVGRAERRLVRPVRARSGDRR